MSRYCIVEHECPYTLSDFIGVSDACIKSILSMQDDDTLDLYNGVGFFSEDNVEKPIRDISTRHILNETGTEIYSDLIIVLQNIRKHSHKYLKDFNRDGRVTCEDLVYLLYLGTTVVKSPVSIECSDFWAWYQINAAFRKFSLGYDLNKEEVSLNSLKGLSLQFSRDEVPLTDLGFHRCGNTQCVLSSRRCDGKPECKDLTDEQDCSVCPELSVQCKVRGVQTCLPRQDLCRYNPDTCQDVNLQICQDKSWQQKLEDCFNKLEEKSFDNTFRL